MSMSRARLIRCAAIWGFLAAVACSAGPEGGGDEFDFRGADGDGMEGAPDPETGTPDVAPLDTGPAPDGMETGPEDVDGGGTAFVQVTDFCKNSYDHQIDVGLPRDTGPRSFSPNELTIDEHTVVRWKNQTFDRHTIVNRTPLHARGEYFSEHIAGAEATFCVEFGELPDFADGSMTVEYYCSRHSATGTITIEKR